MQEWLKNRIKSQNIVKEILPDIKANHQSGIYLWWRVDTNGIYWYYCGKATDIYERTLQHYMGYSQRLDLSLKKRKLYSNENPNGWQFTILEFTNDLDNRERYYILDYMRRGWQSYNKESGGTAGKETFDLEEAKGYKTGIIKGYSKAKEEMIKYLKYCDITPKSGKRAESMYNKLQSLLEADND